MKQRKDRLLHEENILLGFTSSFEGYFKFEKFFEPHYLLWTTVEKFLDEKYKWKSFPANKLNVEEIENLKAETQAVIRKLKNKFETKQKEVIDSLSRQINDLQSWLPIIETLSNPGLKSRHWEEIKLVSGPDLNFKKLSVDRIKFLKIEHLLPPIQKISEIASKEHSLEKYLDSMDEEIEAKQSVLKESPNNIEALNEFKLLINEQLSNIKTLKTNKHILHLLERVKQKENDLHALLESLS